MMIPNQFLNHLNNGPLHEEPTRTSPEDEGGPSYSSVDPDFSEVTVPHLILRFVLNHLVRDLNLAKTQTELLASRL
jgi:hypothetical protein